MFFSHQRLPGKFLMRDRPGHSVLRKSLRRGATEVRLSVRLHDERTKKWYGGMGWMSRENGWQRAGEQEEKGKSVFVYFGGSHKFFFLRYSKYSSIHYSKLLQHSSQDLHPCLPHRKIRIGTFEIESVDERFALSGDKSHKPSNLVAILF